MRSIYFERCVWVPNFSTQNFAFGIHPPCDRRASWTSSPTTNKNTSDLRVPRVSFALGARHTCVRSHFVEIIEISVHYQDSVWLESSLAYCIIFYYYYYYLRKHVLERKTGFNAFLAYFEFILPQCELLVPLTNGPLYFIFICFCLKVNSNWLNLIWYYIAYTMLEVIKKKYTLKTISLFFNQFSPSFLLLYVYYYDHYF